MKIRQARPEDEAALYEVCLRTGNSGEDAREMYEDPRALGHIYAGPYLRLEPELALVLEDDQGVAGYVLGALDSQAFYARFLREWLPPLRARHPDPTGDPTSWTPTQRCYHLYHHPAPFVPEPAAHCPAHLHIDLLPRAQGRGHGRAMLEALFARLRARGAPGVHLGVGEKNTRAIAFYRKVGFHELCRQPGCLYLGLSLREGAALDRWDAAVQEQLRAVRETQRPAIETASRWVVEALAADRWLWVFGTGHSHLLAEEVFYRAGGLARAAPILHEPLMLHESAARSSELEQGEGYAEKVLADYALGPGDVLLVASSSGRNAVPIEVATLARARGARVVAITNLRHANAAPSRHSSGKRLHDVVDLVIDNCGVPGDAALSLDGLAAPIGPTSTITGAWIVNAIVVGAIERLVAAGRAPEVYGSANLGGAHNQSLLARYRGRIRHL